MDKSKALQILSEDSNPVERIIAEDKLEQLMKGEKNIRLQKFQKLLHTDPWKHETLSGHIKKHPVHGNPYLPIGVVEMLLDQLYFGLWSARITKQEQVLNEYVVTVELEVTHPTTGDKITRPGIAATPNQQDSGAKPHQIELKKVRAMEKDAPHALANSIKNAAQKLGKIFGRDLARDWDSTIEEYTGLIGEEKEKAIHKSLGDLIAESKKQNDGKATQDK